MKRLRRQGGFSLLEILVTMTVFSLVAAGIAAGTAATIKGNSASRDTSAGAALIHDKVEQLRALDPAASPTDLLPGYHNDPLNPLNALGRRGGSFMRSWTVTPNTPSLGLAEVVITVSWNGPETRTLSAITYVCQTPTCT